MAHDVGSCAGRIDCARCRPIIARAEIPRIRIVHIPGVGVAIVGPHQVLADVDRRRTHTGHAADIRAVVAGTRHIEAHVETIHGAGIHAVLDLDAVGPDAFAGTRIPAKGSQQITGTGAEICLKEAERSGRKRAITEQLDADPLLRIGIEIAIDIGITDRLFGIAQHHRRRIADCRSDAGHRDAADIGRGEGADDRGQHVSRGAGIDQNLDEFRIGIAGRGGRLGFVLPEADAAGGVAGRLVGDDHCAAGSVVGHDSLVRHERTGCGGSAGAGAALAVQLRRTRQRGLIGAVLQFGIHGDQPGVIEGNSGNGDQSEQRNRVSRGNRTPLVAADPMHRLAKHDSTPFPLTHLPPEIAVLLVRSGLVTVPLRYFSIAWAA